MNYFKLLELEQKYDIAPSLLEQQYLNKQLTYHPDKAESEPMRGKYLEISMQLNDAYKILKDDYMRAEYMLKLSGQKFDDDTLKNKLSNSEIEEIIDEYELIDEIDQLPKLKEIQLAKNSDKLKLTKELTDCFSNNETAKALDLTVRLKYLTNLVRNIKLKIKHADSRDQ
ncbi:MAG: Fe-S protein assembly co-chaperone HscB [Rickettsiales bacterium]|nr:MAG: Fe-S protein assembly co-chaperone HscB [Rickettsiales bacterium]